MNSIATLNTWKCDGDYFKRLEVITKELQILQPHILLLQESFQTSDNQIDTSRSIAKRLGYFYVSSRSRFKNRKVNNVLTDSYSNVSIISKYPIINRYIFSLPSNEADGGREAIAAEIEIGNKRLMVISVHLSHLRDGAELRKQQLFHIFDQPFLRGSFDGVFIGGDFNCTMNDLYIAQLENKYFEIEDTFVYKKANDELICTFSTRKIDHILQLWSKAAKKLEILDSKIIFHSIDTEYGVKASDHNGVLVEIELENVNCES